MHTLKACPAQFLFTLGEWVADVIDRLFQLLEHVPVLKKDTRNPKLENLKPQEPETRDPRPETRNLVEPETRNAKPETLKARNLWQATRSRGTCSSF